MLRAVVQRPVEAPDAAPSWSVAALAGRLVELGGAGAQAVLTAAFGLVLDAQRSGEPAAWIAPRASTFYPPDVAANGVDLEALVVVRTSGVAQVPRAADTLARSGAFGLLVLDLHGTPPVAVAVQARLLGLAQKHAIAVVCLVESEPSAAAAGGEPRTPLGSLVSLRARVQRTRSAPGAFAYRVRVLKDKHRAPGWEHVEACRGPAGVR